MSIWSYDITSRNQRHPRHRLATLLRLTTCEARSWGRCTNAAPQGVRQVRRVRIGNLVVEPPSRAEFNGLLGSARHRLQDAENNALNLESRFDRVADEDGPIPQRTGRLPPR